MEIRQLNDKNYLELSKKTIICFERSDSYLRELEIRFPSVCSSVKYIVDDYKRNQGVCSFAGHDIEVWGTETLKSVDFSNSIILILSDYYQEAFDKLNSIPEVVNNNEIIYFFPNHETEIELFYREKYADDDLRDLIIFRSGPHASAYVKGMDFADNARAVFEYMLAEGYNKKYELVWYVKNPDEFSSYKKYDNVKFYSFDWSITDNENNRNLYYDSLCHAKFLFFTDAYGFARNCRKDQVRIQLWHGCGFKTRTNFVPCEKRYEYNIVISEKYRQIHKEIYGLRDDQVVITGYPKEDLLFHPVNEKKLEKLGIPKSDRYIFWLPTFRSATEQLKILDEFVEETEVGLPIIYKTEELVHLNNILVDKDMVMVIKLHPFQKKNSVHCSNLSNIVLLENEQLVDADVEINGLLAWADALISDYSSAAIDYLILNRPIAFTLDDVEEYSQSRGFVFDNIREWLPGKEIFSVNDFFTYVEEIGNRVDSAQEKRNSVRRILHQFNDDQSSKRVLDMFGITKG